MKKLFIILLFFGLFSCQKDDKPKELLDRNTYKHILKELIWVNMVKNNHRAKDSLKFDALQLVYQKYNVDSLILKKNADYYAKHPELLEKMYKEIKSDFQHQLDSLTKSDSIRRETKEKVVKKIDSITIPNDILKLGVKH